MKKKDQKLNWSTKIWFSTLDELAQGKKLLEQQNGKSLKRKYCIKSVNEVPTTKKSDQVENLIEDSTKKLGDMKNNLNFTGKTNLPNSCKDILKRSKQTGDRSERHFIYGRRPEFMGKGLEQPIRPKHIITKDYMRWRAHWKETRTNVIWDNKKMFKTSWKKYTTGILHIEKILEAWLLYLNCIHKGLSEELQKTIKSWLVNSLVIVILFIEREMRDAIIVNY